MQYKSNLLIFLAITFFNQIYGSQSSKIVVMNFIKTALKQHPDITKRYSLSEERFNQAINIQLNNQELKQNACDNLKQLEDLITARNYLANSSFKDLSDFLYQDHIYPIKAPQNLKSDIQEIASRVGYEKFADVELCKPIPNFINQTIKNRHYALIPRSTLLLSSQLYDNGTRKRLLCSTGHELMHLKYHDNKQMLANCAYILNFINESDYFEISQNMEYQADLAPIFALGNGHDLANFYNSLHQKNITLNVESEPTHPLYIDRFKSCINLHKAYVHDINYLKNRLWKIGWIIRSWANHEYIDEPEEKNHLAINSNQKNFKTVIQKILNTFPEWNYYLNYDFATWNEGLKNISNAELNYLCKEVLVCARIYKKIKQENNISK